MLQQSIKTILLVSAYLSASAAPLVQGRLTPEVPLPVLDVGAHVPGVRRQQELQLGAQGVELAVWTGSSNRKKVSYIEAVVGPAAKLHLTVLVVEGEPGDVDLAGGHEDAGGDVGAQPLVRHHHISRVGSVKGLTRTEIMESRLRTHTYFLGY